MEAKFYDTMEEALKSYREQGFDGEVGIAKYGDKFLIYAEQRICEGCQEPNHCSFFEGLWLCPVCVIRSIVEQENIPADMALQIGMVVQD